MTTFNKWDELDRRGLPRASYINARVALHRLDALCSWNKNDDGADLRWEWALFDVDSDRPMWRTVQATDLRDAIIDVFGFDPGAKPLKQAMAAMEAEACRRRPPMRLDYPEWVPGESQAMEQVECAV